MDVELRFPIEFVVPGTPVSLQVKRPESRIAWKARVRGASSGAVPEGHFSTSGPITVTMFYFPNTLMQGDLDNIVKPVLDALTTHIYADDRQVERVWVQKFEPGHVFPFGGPSAVLAEAIRGIKPLLYIRLGDDPAEGLA